MDTEELTIEEKIEEISLDGYEVVRGEDISQSDKPVITFNGYVVSFNAAALKSLPEVESVLLMVKREDESICARPCRNGEKGAFRWCSFDTKRTARKGTCIEFVKRLMKFAGWSFDFRYKLLGGTAIANGVLALKFDINSAQKSPRKNKEDTEVRKSVLIQPEEWSDEFGPSFSEHERIVNMPTFNEDTTIIISTKKEGDDNES